MQEEEIEESDSNFKKSMEKYWSSIQNFTKKRKCTAYLISTTIKI